MASPDRQHVPMVEAGTGRVGKVRVAMVCLGNICRSPMAEAVGQAMVDQAGLNDRVVVESFGTAGYHVGSGADPRSLAALRRRGWPPPRARARRLTADDIARCAVLLCADHHNMSDVRRLARGESDRAKVHLLRSFDPAAAAGDDEVPDPWGGGAGDFDHALALIESACRGLVDHLADRTRKGGDQGVWRPVRGCRAD